MFADVAGTLRISRSPRSRAQSDPSITHGSTSVDHLCVLTVDFFVDPPPARTTRSPRRPSVTADGLALFEVWVNLARARESRPRADSVADGTARATDDAMDADMFYAIRPSARERESVCERRGRLELRKGAAAAPL
jgi:hypothetical protein